MTTIYAAHIIIREAEGFNEIVVTTRPTDGERADEIAAYPLIAGVEAREVLSDAGWRVVGPESKTEATASVEAGYVIVDVEPADIESVIRHVTISRDHAETVFQDADKAWRTVIRNAALNGVSVDEIAASAVVSPERIQQVLSETGE